MRYMGRGRVVKWVIIVIRGVGGYESSVVEVVVDIEYGGIVVEWV